MRFHDFMDTGVRTDDLSKHVGGFAKNDLKGVPGATWYGGLCWASENNAEDTEGAYVFEDFPNRILVIGDFMAVSCAAYIWALETGAITAGYE